jgi:ferric-dicitrate binding protein FerR (iron transport regulator)
MNQDQFWNLLAKKLSGEASEEEIRELAAMIKTNPELSFAAQNVVDLWKVKPIENKQAAEEAFQKLMIAMEQEDDSATTAANQLSSELNRQETPKSRKRRFLLMGSLVLLIVASFYLWHKHAKPNEAVATNQLQEIYTRPGTKTRVVLPDSSIVWLNAGSKLTYQQPFGIADRKVTLTGEAYFDVEKSSKLFIIHTNGAQIKVLGTAFNVRSYPSEKKIETSLVHGRVEVMLDEDPESKYVLKPNEKLTLNTEQQGTKSTGRQLQTPIVVRSTLHHIDEETIAEISWIENKLVFEDESFEDVALKLERWYGVIIRFKNEKVKSERLTGVFEKETIWQALTTIQEIIPFRFTVKHNEITITH